ncbi:MAG: MFS transporter [Verrucomicrobia bacterium]|nr:MFS transporter [Verrucomicrobiota bacterium]
MSTSKPKKHESLLLNLICNIALPTLLLTVFSKEKYLGPLWGLIVALIFPVGYGIWDFATRKKTNFISIIGFVSVLLSGGFGLMKVGGFWFAVKDAAMPIVIGIAVLLSLRSKEPLIRELLFNEQVIDIPRVDAALAERNARPAFDSLLVRASYALAATFFASAGINFATARWIIRSEPGTEAFNAELGKMHSIGMVVMAVPAMIMLMLVLWRLIGGIQRLTGLDMDSIFKGGEGQKKSGAA